MCGALKLFGVVVLVVHDNTLVNQPTRVVLYENEIFIKLHFEIVNCAHIFHTQTFLSREVSV